MTLPIGLAILALTTVGASAEPKLDASLRREVENRVAIVHEWAADPIVVEAVRVANRDLRTLAEIREIDAEWRNHVGVSKFMRKIMTHPASERLRELRTVHPELKESIVTDRLGANVAVTNRTSDFYQGDEEKFLAVYHRGPGAVYLSEVHRDESIQAISIQISVPVVFENESIGVLSVTVNLEKMASSAKSVGHFWFR